MKFVKLNEDQRDSGRRNINSGRSVGVILESWGKGGTESYVRGLIKSLRVQGFDFFLIILKPEGRGFIDFLSADKVVSINIYQLPFFLLKNRVTLVSLHLYSSLLPVTLLCKFARIYIVATLHMPISSWGVRNRIYWGIATRLVDDVVGVSRLVNGEIKVSALYPEPVPGGVHSDFFKVERKRRSGGNDDMPHRIFAVGRLSKEKDWPTLVRAASLLPNIHREKIVIDFFGDGALNEDLNELAKGLDVPVVMHGFVDKKRLALEFEDAAISVLPSRFEGFGLAAIESMAAGVPTITSDFEASKDFITEGETGFRFPAGDAEALSRLILEIIERPSKANEIARQGREFVWQNFSEDKTYLPYVNLFHHNI